MKTYKNIIKVIILKLLKNENKYLTRYPSKTELTNS